LSFQFTRYPFLSLSGFLTVAALRLCAGSPAADTIYLESNSTAGNSVFTYRFNFTSAPVLQTTTPAGGIGVFDPSFALGPFDSDQNLTENSSGTLLFAVNSGSNTIAVFNIHPDGSLNPVSGSPFPSGGSDPVSVGLKGNTLVVVNKDQENAHEVGISFDDAEKGSRGVFTGLVNVTTFGKEQYQWHANPKGGFADPDGPVVKSTMNAGTGTKFTLPAASITVIRGKVAR